ncbi:MAG: chitobiase/beta-hexosaminidase C-terminal domain-containing protein [Bacteroidaceae bacterium]|nr:chitobiase/beta-hexosaminidase C-terminal domain-containing protein [Bacteroidaceae bacterium]
MQTSADYDTWTVAGTFTKATGTQTVEIPTDKQAANLFYRIVFDCARGTNGNVRVTRVDYYREADDPNAVAIPVISGDPVFASSTDVTITCGTAGATILYSTDHGISWKNYNGPIHLTETTTITAKATKEGMTESQEVSKSFCHAEDVEDVTWNLKAAPTGSSAAASATWTKDAQGEDTGAVMSLAKGGSSNNANAHIGQSDGTYFYNGQILRIAPLEGYTIVSVVITASSNSDATGIRGGNWTNASATASGSTVTVTPEDGTLSVSVVSSAGYESMVGVVTGEKYYTITGVKVEYAPTTSPYIATIDVVNATSEGASGTIEVVYNKVDNTDAEVVVVDGEGNAVDWLSATLDADKNIAYTIAPNTDLEARTAYIVVSVDDLSSPAITVTQEKPYTVKIGKIGYTTYVAPADIVFPEGLTAYVVYEHTGSAARLAEKASVPAGTAVVLKSEDAMSSTDGIEYALSITTSPEDVSENLLKAAETAFNPSDENTIYCLANKSKGVGFYPVAVTVSVPVGKAYLEVTSGAAPVKGFFGFEDDATGIENLNANVNLNEGIFNLAGQRIQKMQKGINIINGKKVLK